MKISQSDYQGLVPYIAVLNCADAIKFYKDAFGASERYRLDTVDTGSIGHCELVINDQVFMVADEFPGFSKSPETLDEVSYRFVLIAKNADEAFDKAVKAGATSIMGPLVHFFVFDRVLKEIHLDMDGSCNIKLKRYWWREFKSDGMEVVGECKKIEMAKSVSISVYNFIEFGLLDFS